MRAEKSYGRHDRDQAMVHYILSGQNHEAVLHPTIPQRARVHDLLRKRTGPQSFMLSMTAGKFGDQGDRDHAVLRYTQVGDQRGSSHMGKPRLQTVLGGAAHGSDTSSDTPG